jgi:hypothetical protein
MKPYLLLLLALPLLLVGCAPAGYVGDYPASGPGYYAPDYYSGPAVSVAYHNSGSYHGYHHYANNYHHAYASNGRSYHSGGTQVASTSGSHVSGSRGHAGNMAHVSSGQWHN